MHAPGRAPDNFNLLRLLLAAAVVFSHCFELVDRSRVHEPLTMLFHTYNFGDLAVDGFFLLSGFLIAQSWQRDPQALRYLARRVLRIYPAFIVATLICGLLLGPLFGGAQYFNLLRPGEFIKWMLLLREPALPPVFLGLPYTDSNGPLWTIQYEFQCYLLVIVAGLLGARAPRAAWWLVFLGAMTLNLFFPGALDQFHFPGARYVLGDSPAVFLRFLTFFSGGALMFLHRDAVKLRGGWAALALVVAFVSLWSQDAAKLLLPTAGAYGLFWFAFQPLPAHGAFDALQRFVRRNDLSYGVYVFGWPVQQILIALLRIESPWLLLAPALLGAGACAWLSWRLVEQPFLRLKPAAA